MVVSTMLTQASASTAEVMFEPAPSLESVTNVSSAGGNDMLAMGMEVEWGRVSSPLTQTTDSVSDTRSPTTRE